MSFLANIKASEGIRTSTKHRPETPKYFGGIGKKAKRAFEDFEVTGEIREPSDRVITYYGPDEAESRGKSAQYGQLSLRDPISWKLMIEGEAWNAADASDRAGVETPWYLPYASVKPGATTALPISCGMTSDQPYGKYFADGLKLAREGQYGQLVEALLVKANHPEA